MNLAAFVLALVLAGLLAASLRRPPIGVFGFVALAPFYYVWRGLAGQTAFAFLWPYLYIAAYGHVLGLLVMRRAVGPPRLAERSWLVLGGLYGAILLAGIAWPSFVRAVFGAPLTAVIREFNDHRLVVFAVLALGLVAWPLLVSAARRQASLAALSWLDWIMVALLAYGVLQAGLSFSVTRHLFYVLESFRYYFVMMSVYFMVRFGLREERDGWRTAVIIGATSVIGGLEYVVEYYLFNHGVSSLRLPWLVAFDSIFPGYGRPLATNGFYIVADGSANVFIPFEGVRGIGLFLHPHTLGFFTLLGAAFVVPRLFDVRRRGLLLLPLVALLLYATMLTMSRSAMLLMALTLTALPAATAVVLRHSFARRRLPLYALALAATLYVGSTFSPGGTMPHLIAGWYLRPFLTTTQAFLGDTVGWANRAERPVAFEPPQITVKGSANAVAAALTVLREQPAYVLVLGRGFSPLTKYVVEFFPEASGHRYLQSTADLVYFEYFQQFGLAGIALLLAHFVAFAFVAGRHAWRRRDDRIGLLAVGTCCTLVFTAIALGHLYVIYRIGVNTAYYAVLGIVGFIEARHRSRAGLGVGTEA